MSLVSFQEPCPRLDREDVLRHQPASEAPKLELASGAEANASRTELDGTGVSLELPGGGGARVKEDDEDSAFESNGRNEDELEDELDDLQVSSWYIY